MIVSGQYENGEFKLKWTTSSLSTDFDFTTKISDTNNIWSSFAFSTDKSMGNDDVCVCRITDSVNAVEHFYNPGKSAPILLVSNQPSIGFSNITVKYENGILRCTFTRLKSMPNVVNYFDLSNQYYVLTALGRVVSNGILQKHTVKYSSSEKIDFQSTNSYVGNNDLDKEHKRKAHGCLMVIAWIFFASTGILLARNYKYLFPNAKLCGLEFWFVIHRPFMIIVSLISITAFIVILSELDWKWVTTDEPLNFAHSIFGIVAIGLPIIQV